jgi:hypothetical protein
MNQTIAQRKQLNEALIMRDQKNRSIPVKRDEHEAKQTEPNQTDVSGFWVGMLIGVLALAAYSTF